MKRETIICSCFNSEHQINFIHDPDDKLVYCEIHLVKLPFLKRLKYGLKYIFGYKCRYGCFDEFIFTEEHIHPLKHTIETLNSINTENDNEFNIKLKECGID